MWTHIDERIVYLMIEYVAGGELFNYLRTNGQFEEVHVRMYIAELVLALEYLHGRNIIHRDIKPENILVDDAGHLKLTDFEFAKLLANGSAL